MSAEPTCWRLTLPCTRAEAMALAGETPALDALEPRPVVMTSEPDPAEPEHWRLDVYVEREPDAALAAAIGRLVPSATGMAPVIEAIADEDWVTRSQAGLPAIDAGRFHVRTPAETAPARSGAIVFTIAAGRAFGTGHHQTTTGCLLMIDRLAARGVRATDIADVGTGTGLLAFAARSVWPAARVIAGDIDPVSIEVAAENAAANHVPVGRGRRGVALVTAPGLAHPLLARRAPYDLIIANILAGPLIELAPSLAGALSPGGSLILAGLLTTQADSVAATYRRQGLRLADRIDRGDWPTLRMVRRRSARSGLPPVRDRIGGDWASDGA